MAKMWLVRAQNVDEPELDADWVTYQLFERKPEPTPKERRLEYGKWGNCGVLVMDKTPFECAFGITLLPGEGPVPVEVSVIASEQTA